MATPRQRATGTILTLLRIVIAGVFGLRSPFYREAMVEAYFGFSLASVVILHL
jgi:hypothetical protein